MQLPPGVGELIPGVLFVGPHTACERMVSDFGVRYVVECLSDDERRNLHEQRYFPLTKNLGYSKQVLDALSEAVSCCLEAGPTPSATACTAQKHAPIEPTKSSRTGDLSEDDIAALKTARSSLLNEFGKSESSKPSQWDQLGQTDAPEDVNATWTKAKQAYLNLILDKALSAARVRRDATTLVPAQTAELIEAVEKFQQLVAEAVRDDGDQAQDNKHVDPATESGDQKPSSSTPAGLVEDPASAVDGLSLPVASPEDEDAMWRGYRLSYPNQVRVVTVPMEDSLTEDLTLALNVQRPIQPFQEFGIGNDKISADGITAGAAIPTHAYRQRWTVAVGADGKQRLVPVPRLTPSSNADAGSLLDETEGQPKSHAIAREALHRQGLDHIGAPIVTGPDSLPMPLHLVTLLDEILCQNPSTQYLEQLSTEAMTRMLAKRRKEQDAALGYAASKVTEIDNEAEGGVDGGRVEVPVFERHAVFLHCYAGKSRSPALAAAYVMLSQYLAARTTDSGTKNEVIALSSPSASSDATSAERSAGFDRRAPLFVNPPLYNLEEAMELLCHCGPLTVTRGFNVPSVPENDSGDETFPSDADPNSIAEIVLDEAAVQSVHGICASALKQYRALVSLQQQFLEAKLQRGGLATNDNAEETGLNDDAAAASQMVPDTEAAEGGEEAPVSPKEEALKELHFAVEKGTRQVAVLEKFLGQIKDAHTYNHKTLADLRKNYETAYISKFQTPSTQREEAAANSAFQGMGTPGSRINFGRIVTKARGVRPNPKLIQDLLGIENAVMLAHQRTQQLVVLSQALRLETTFDAAQIQSMDATAKEPEEPYATAFDIDDYNLEGLLDLFVRGESGNMVSTLTEPEVYNIFMSPEVDRDVVKARRVLTKEHAKRLFSSTSRRQQMAQAICSLLNEDEEQRIASERKAAQEEEKQHGGAPLQGTASSSHILARGIQIMMEPDSIVEILLECKDDFQTALMRAMSLKKKKLEEASQSAIINAQ